MTLAQIRAEVQARGFDYVTNARVDTWINRSYQRINDREAWQFLEATATGAAPLTIASVRAVLSVIDTVTERVLEYDDERTIRERDPSLSRTANPDSWYLDGTQIKVFPLSTNNLNVRHLAFPATLTLDADTPIWPARYHYILVDAAVAQGYKDSDNMETFAIAQEDVNQQVFEMATALLIPNFDTPASIAPSGFGATDW